MSEHSLQKPRTLKVQDVGDFYKRKITPQIQLRGLWLLAAGLKPETHVRITNPRPGILIVESLE